MYYKLCYMMQYIRHCLYTCIDSRMLKLLWFIHYLRCQEQAINKSDEDYMLVIELYLLIGILYLWEMVLLYWTSRHLQNIIISLSSSMIATRLWKMGYTGFELKFENIIHLKMWKRENYHCPWIWIGNNYSI